MHVSLNIFACKGVIDRNPASVWSQLMELHHNFYSILFYLKIKIQLISNIFFNYFYFIQDTKFDTEPTNFDKVKKNEEDYTLMIVMNCLFTQIRYDNFLFIYYVQTDTKNEICDINENNINSFSLPNV